ncbi:hypothetical protein EYC84_005782 [Monilinia fructicola]|uniref:Uncharacterized protein n=1 Tax=Monilinia fructicola TaxID=38448 RepID=A0A5M9K066_MONFR|nr:hypothetical protein EYC84_005782 [Monilinia fructicola]
MKGKGDSGEPIVKGAWEGRGMSRRLLSYAFRKHLQEAESKTRTEPIPLSCRSLTQSQHDPRETTSSLTRLIVCKPEGR